LRGAFGLGWLVIDGGGFFCGGFRVGIGFRAWIRGALGCSEGVRGIWSAVFIIRGMSGVSIAGFIVPATLIFTIMSAFLLYHLSCDINYREIKFVRISHSTFFIKTLIFPY
jgi:hypothetical protein